MLAVVTVFMTRVDFHTFLKNFMSMAFSFSILDGEIWLLLQSMWCWECWSKSILWWRMETRLLFIVMLEEVAQDWLFAHGLSIMNTGRLKMLLNNFLIEGQELYQKNLKDKCCSNSKKISTNLELFSLHRLNLLCMIIWQGRGRFIH